MNMPRQVIMYDLYDMVGKVMETRDKNVAMAWKKKGEEKRFRGHKTQYIKRRKIWVR